jgi:hypothetical protein
MSPNAGNDGTAISVGSHSPETALSEDFLSPRNRKRLGPRRFVGKVDWELQTADYGIRSGNKSFARQVVSTGDWFACKGRLSCERSFSPRPG